MCDNNVENAGARSRRAEDKNMTFATMHLLVLAVVASAVRAKRLPELARGWARIEGS